MLPEFTCNFLATLAHPPWTTALRRNVYMTLEGEERTPFSLYVQPSSAIVGSLSQTTLFLHFNALPDELQLRVLTFCPASTLFQLMRVSSSLRTEASKLFWAHPDAYFLVKAQWLLDGGYPGYTHSDLAFLAHVQNVQVEYELGAEDSICPLRDETVEVQQDRITDFWKVFTKRCPRAKRVIVTQSWMSLPTRKETQSVPKALRLLLESCPLGITASSFVVEEADVCTGLYAAVLGVQKWQRVVHQLGADKSWEKTKVGQDWKAILVPAKRFTGPVGRFQEVQYRGSLLVLEEDGLWPILVEALDRYYFEDGKSRGFLCPSAGCNEHFQKAGEWTIHAAELHNHEWRRDERLQLLPQAIRGEFKERERILGEKRKKIEQEARKIHEEWERGGEQQQREIQCMWREQLENDAAWEMGEDACYRGQGWQEFWEEMAARDGGKR
jgi:hypothetical protein